MGEKAADLAAGSDEVNHEQLHAWDQYRDQRDQILMVETETETRII